MLFAAATPTFLPQYYIVQIIIELLIIIQKGYLRVVKVNLLGSYHQIRNKKRIKR